jgi:hypothetical protein
LLPPQIPAGVLVELQFCAGGPNCLSSRAPTFALRNSSTHAQPVIVAVADLMPVTIYAFWMRFSLDGLGGERWTERVKLGTCKTARLRPGQVGFVQLRAPPKLDAISLSWHALSTRIIKTTGERIPPNYTVACFVPGTASTFNASAALPSLPRGETGRGRAKAAQDALAASVASVSTLDEHATIRGLQPDTPYECTVTGVHKLKRHMPSDPFPVSTRAPGTRALRVYRVSEDCNDRCQPEYLSERNSGDASADAAFISEVTAPDSGHEFGIDLPTAVITSYCLQLREVSSRAEYLACNHGGNAFSTDKSARFECTCSPYIDRLIARDANLSMCQPSAAAGRGERVCECSAAGLRASEAAVTTMPVHIPLPNPNGHELRVPPKDGSLFAGHFYATPRRAQCREGEALGTAGCAWRRVHAAQTIVRGVELLVAGWRELPPRPSVVQMRETVMPNAQLLERLMDEREARCCGC